MTNNKRFVQSDDVETISFDWGTSKWLSTAEMTGAETFSTGVVFLGPGKAHERHTHPDSEEVLYFLSGTGIQTIGNEEQDVAAGDLVYIPAGVGHSTQNTGWDPLRFLAIYGPPGPEAGLADDENSTVFPPNEIPHA